MVGIDCTASDVEMMYESPVGRNLEDHRISVRACGNPVLCSFAVHTERINFQMQRRRLEAYASGDRAPAGGHVGLRDAVPSPVRPVNKNTVQRTEYRPPGAG